MVTRPSRMYSYSPANYDSTMNTPETCKEACTTSGYAYASVSAGGLCLCGSLSANTTLLNSTTTLCQTIRCTGDSNISCGDNDYELVYMTTGFIDVSLILFQMFSFVFISFELKT